MPPTIALSNEITGMSNHATTNTLRIHRDPIPHAPGAFALDGPNDVVVVGGQDDDNNFTYTQQDDSTNVNNMNGALPNPANPVKACLVDTVIQMMLRIDRNSFKDETRHFGNEMRLLNKCRDSKRML
jgi:hypothetical protein